MAKQPRQQPIGFYGKFQPTGVDNSAAQRMQALAGLGETVAGVAEKFGIAKANELAPEEGRKAAEKALAEGTELQKRGSLSWGGEAYNDAAFAAYYAGATSDLQSAVLDSEAAYPDDVAAYQSSVDAKRAGLLKNAPDAIKAKANRYYDQINSTAVRRINSAAKIKVDEFLSASFEKGFSAAEDNISNLYFDGDIDAGREAEMQLIVDGEAGVQAGFLDQLKVDSNLSRVRDTATIQTQLGVIDRVFFGEGGSVGQRLQKADAFVTSLRDSADLSDLSATQKATVIASVQSKINSVRNEYQANQNKQTREQMLEISDLKNAIDLGVGSFEDQSDQARSLFDREVITGNELTTIRSAINASALKDHSKLIGIANAQALNTGRATLTSDPVTATDANNAYELLDLPEDPDARRATQVNFVKNVGHVTTTLKQELRNNLVSPDIIGIQSASRTIDAIQDIPGIGENAFTPAEIALASQVIILDKYTDSTEDAIKQAKQIVTPGTPTQAAMVKARKEEIKDNKKDYSEAYPSEASNIFESWLPFAFPTKSDVQGTRGFALMTADYGKLVESYYLAGMDSLGNAKAKAAAAIKANWGNTKEFGLMNYSVDKFYSLPDDSVSYIKDELVNLLSTDERQVLPENIYLDSDGETARGASVSAPTYRVLERLDDGTLISPYMNDGQGGLSNRFKPDAKVAIANYKENIHLEELAQVAAPYGKTTFKANTSLTTSQQNAMRKALQSSNSPFALIGKGVDAASKIPSLITVKNADFVIQQALIHSYANWGSVQLEEAYDYIVKSVSEASNNYVASINKASKTQSKVATEIQEIDNMINENLVEFQGAQTPAVGSVIVSPSATTREQAKGVIPEDFALTPRSISPSMVSEMLSDATVGKEWKDKYKIVVDKVGPIDAEIIFNHYFGEPITNALRQGS